ncbi:uncharacterized protein LOC135125786 [Zophobas morio]|uniref:uncharacterized protein LOC135125786 n=1 Tax=Zophobas morio TaxID=2755281 RepID=UPI0030835558
MAKALDECFSNSVFAHTCITAGSPLCAVLHFSGCLIALAFACFSGQILINASESVSESIWFSKWYEADLRLQKDILFMLTKSQKIFYLTAGPFSTLSFPLLVSIVKFSYSLFCLLTS